MFPRVTSEVELVIDGMRERLSGTYEVQAPQDVDFDLRVEAILVVADSLDILNLIVSIRVHGFPSAISTCHPSHKLYLIFSRLSDTQSARHAAYNYSPTC